MTKQQKDYKPKDIKAAHTFKKGIKDEVLRRKNSAQRRAGMKKDATVTGATHAIHKKKTLRLMPTEAETRKINEINSTFSKIVSKIPLAVHSILRPQCPKNFFYGK